MKEFSEVEILEAIQYLAKNNHGVIWRKTHNQFYPFTVNGEIIVWNETGGSEDYQDCLIGIYKKVKMQHFKESLKLASEIVSTWPEWKRKILG